MVCEVSMIDVCVCFVIGSWVNLLFIDFSTGRYFLFFERG